MGGNTSKNTCFKGPTPLYSDFFCPFSPGLARFLFFPSEGGCGENTTTRRKHRLEVDGPDSTAKRTIERLTEKVKEAQASPTMKYNWEQKYFSGIEKYADDPERQRVAEEKLATWYGVVMDDVAPNYSRVMAKARANYHRRLAQKYKHLAEAEEEEEGEDDELGITF